MPLLSSQSGPGAICGQRPKASSNKQLSKRIMTRVCFVLYIISICHDKNGGVFTKSGSQLRLRRLCAYADGFVGLSTTRVFALRLCSGKNLRQRVLPRSYHLLYLKTALYNTYMNSAVFAMGRCPAPPRAGVETNTAPRPFPRDRAKLLRLKRPGGKSRDFLSDESVFIWPRLKDRGCTSGGCRPPGPPGL